MRTEVESINFKLEQISKARRESLSKSIEVYLKIKEFLKQRDKLSAVHNGS